MTNIHLPTNHCVNVHTLHAIRSRHRLLLEAEQRVQGIWEIGYGCRVGVMPGATIGPCQAEDLLRNDVQYVEAFIRLAVARRISDRCYQALVSYLYDVGPKAEASRIRLARLHEGGEETFFLGLEGEARASRFGENIGRPARFFEVNYAG